MIAYEDNIIKETIENIMEKEDKIKQNFMLLKKFKSQASPSFHEQIDKDLRSHGMFLAYKLLSKEKQCDALFKLLEHINTLDVYDKKLQSNKLLEKINQIEKEIESYRELLT